MLLPESKAANLRPQNELHHVTFSIGLVSRISTSKSRQPGPLPRRTPPARLAALAARLHARLSARRPSPALERRRLPSPPAPAASQPRLARLCACHDSLPIAQPAPPGPRASPYQRPASPSPRRTPRATPAPLSLMLGCRVARRAWRSLLKTFCEAWAPPLR